MKAEIIAFGTEITTGAKLDTNSQWLSRELSDLGIPVAWHTTVADDLDDNVQVLRVATERADLVLITGGLGPTLDDLTRQAIADLCHVPLVLDEESLAAIEQAFRQRGRPMPESNRGQALFPQGAIPLANPIGTAPGLWMTIAREGSPCLLAAMPGVPSEMYRMFREQVRPLLPLEGRVIERFRVNCFGMGESQTEKVLGDLTARGRDPEVGITAHEATITLRVVAHGTSSAECRAKIDATVAIIHERLGDTVFGSEDEELEDVVLRSLRAKGQTISFAECQSQGALGRMLSSSAEADDVFRGGFVYPNLKAVGAMISGATNSEESATVIAKHAQAVFGTDWAIGLAPHDEPALNSIPADTFVILSREGRVITERVVATGNPAIRKVRLAKTALSRLRRELHVS